MKHGAAERQALLPAARKRRHQRILAAGETRHVDGKAHPLGKLFPGHAIDAAEELEILLDREIAIERELLRHVADVLAHAFRIAGDIDAGDDGAASARPQQAAEDADDGRLPRAIGTEEAHDFALGDLEAHMVDGDEIAEPLDQLIGHDLGRAVRTSLLGHAHVASSVSSNATNTSSMLGEPTATSV